MNHLIKCKVSKAVNDTGPQYLKKYFTLKDHVYGTRRTVMTFVSKFKSEKFDKRSLSYEDPFLWNSVGNSFKLSL